MRIVGSTRCSVCGDEILLELGDCSTDICDNCSGLKCSDTDGNTDWKGYSLTVDIDFWVPDNHQDEGETSPYDIHEDYIDYLFEESKG